MANFQEIPCGKCSLWNSKRKKFSCNHKQCKALNQWLHTYVPKLSFETVEIQMQVQENTIQYIV